MDQTTCLVLKERYPFFFAHVELLDSEMTELMASLKFNLIYKEASNE